MFLMIYDHKTSLWPLPEYELIITFTNFQFSAMHYFCNFLQNMDKTKWATCKKDSKTGGMDDELRLDNYISVTIKVMIVIMA